MSYFSIGDLMLNRNLCCNEECCYESLVYAHLRTQTYMVIIELFNVYGSCCLLDSSLLWIGQFLWLGFLKYWKELMIAMCLFPVLSELAYVGSWKYLGSFVWHSWKLIVLHILVKSWACYSAYSIITVLLLYLHTVQQETDLLRHYCLPTITRINQPCQSSDAVSGITCSIVSQVCVDCLHVCSENYTKKSCFWWRDTKMASSTRLFTKYLGIVFCNMLRSSVGLWSTQIARLSYCAELCSREAEAEKLLIYWRNWRGKTGRKRKTSNNKNSEEKRGKNRKRLTWRGRWGKAVDLKERIGRKWISDRKEKEQKRKIWEEIRLRRGRYRKKDD